MAHDESPPHDREGVLVQPPLPVTDVDARVEDGPPHLRVPDAPGPETAAATLHEPPELLHFGDPLDGYANDFGIRRHAQELLGPAQLALVHEEGFALERCVTPHDSLQPIIPIGIHSTSSRHTVNVSVPILRAVTTVLRAARRCGNASPSRAALPPDLPRRSRGRRRRPPGTPEARSGAPRTSR